jgi:hypothetical protein
MIAAIDARKSIGRILMLLCSFVAVSASAGQGWYLLLPPIAVSEGGDDAKIHRERSLPAWTQISAFDSAAECEAERGRKQSFAASEIQGGKMKDANPLIRAMAVAFASMTTLCIASDDPRLKGDR